MVDTRSEFERSWASVERKPDVEKREGTNENESLQRQVDVLTKKLEIYRSREAGLCNELNTMRVEEAKKEKSLLDLKKNNQLILKKVLDQEKELQLMRGRLKENREKSINLSKEIFSMKQQKGLDDKSKKLREENHALKKELMKIRSEHVLKIDPSCDGGDLKQAKRDWEVNRPGQTKSDERMLKWQLWASQDNDDPRSAKVKWTQARSAFGEADFVTFQNEVEEVCQELQEKTCMIQDLRKDLRRREDEFSDSLSKSIIAANDSLAKVKEEAAETISKLQAQLEEKQNVERSNVTLKSQIKSLQNNQESIVKCYNAEQVCKNNQIHALEKTAQTQEHVIKNLNEELQELRNQKEKLSIDKMEETRDLQLQMSAVKDKAETLERTIIELTGTIERQKLDYLAQVQSLQLIIEELEGEGPLSKAIEVMEKTEPMTEVRLRVGDLKAKNQRLQEENLKLGFQIDAASLKVKKMHDLEENNRELRAEYSRMKNLLELFQSPKFDDVQNENLMLRERLKLIAKELRKDERNCLLDETKECQKHHLDGSRIASSSFSNISGQYNDSIPEEKVSVGCNAVKYYMAKDSAKQSRESIDEDKWL